MGLEGVVVISQENAVIDDAKLLDYALNKDHLGGGSHKAIAFERALGYTIDNYQDLKDNILTNVGSQQPIYKEHNGYGHKYQVDLNLVGPNGKKAHVRTGWIFKDDNPSVARMVSAYVCD